MLQIPILLGATLVHLPNGWMFANPNGGFEYPLFWAAALLALALIGPGAYALRELAPLGAAQCPASPDPCDDRRRGACRPRRLQEPLP